MLDKAERQFFAERDAQVVFQTLGGTLSGLGIPLTQTGPNQWSGRGQQASYGVVPRVTVAMQGAHGGFFLEVRAIADLETNAIVLLIVLWLVCLPAALVVAWMGYQDWEQRQRQLLQAVWAPLAGRVATPPGPSFGPPGHGHGTP